MFDTWPDLFKISIWVYQSRISRIYGAEYQTYSTGIYPSSLHDHDVPCAVCHVAKRSSQMMIPGRNICPAGWTREYKGYLMAETQDYHRTMYTCVDEYPNYTRGTHANVNGDFVEGECGSLQALYRRAWADMRSVLSLNMNWSLSWPIVEHHLLSHLFTYLHILYELFERHST
jgi:hypothetical protein